MFTGRKAREKKECGVKGNSYPLVIEKKVGFGEEMEGVES